VGSGQSLKSGSTRGCDAVSHSETEDLAFLLYRTKIHLAVLSDSGAL